MTAPETTSLVPRRCATRTTAHPHSLDGYLIEGSESGGRSPWWSRAWHRVSWRRRRTGTAGRTVHLLMEGERRFEDGGEVVVGTGELVFKPGAAAHVLERR